MRADRQAGGRATFLLDAAAHEIKERLEEVNRSFTRPALVSPFPDYWQNQLPEAVQITEAETLDLAPGGHDLVLHAMGLHWSNDPVGQIIQSRQALCPDGLFLACLFGGETLRELREVLAEAEVTVIGGLSPRILPMGEIRDLGALLGRAGLALPVADSVALDVRYRSIIHLMQDLRAMGETNALSQRLRQPTRRAVFELAGRLYVERYGDADGRIPATFEIIFLTGWAPDASQQQPLKPGSARVSLADVLGPTTDHRKPDRSD